MWLPPEAGYPLTRDGPLFYMLETHYEPPKDRPMEDSSGVSLTITPVLRRHDAGKFFLFWYTVMWYLCSRDDQIRSHQVLFLCYSALFGNMGVKGMFILDAHDGAWAITNISQFVGWNISSGDPPPSPLTWIMFKIKKLSLGRKPLFLKPGLVCNASPRLL